MAKVRVSQVKLAALRSSEGDLRLILAALLKDKKIELVNDPNPGQNPQQPTNLPGPIIFQ